MAFGDDARRWFRTNINDGFPWWTAIVMVACVAMFGLELKQSSEIGGGPANMKPNGYVLVHLGMLVGSLVKFEHEWWRLVTPIFLHGGLGHIVMNSIGLWQLGGYVEQKFGVLRTIVVFVVTGIAGFATTYWFRGAEALSVGASGAIFGYIGCTLGFALRHNERSVKDQVVPMVIFGAIMSFLPGIDWSAHLGGGVSGFLLGNVVADRRTVRRAPDVVWLVAAIAAIAIVVASFVLTATHPFEIPPGSQ